jgi:hypothetical protein
MDPVDRSIIVTVPPRAEYLGLLRSFAGSVAGQQRLPVDDIDDLRLAIDEAFSYLLTLGATPSAVLLSFLPAPDELIVTVAIDAPVSPWPPAGVEDTLPWKVISGLVDRVALERSVQGHAAIVIVKRTLDTSVA